MRPQTPYSDALGDRDPLTAIRQATERIQSLAAKWSDADFEGSYAAGKWSRRQILMHVAQSELAFGVRVRMALSTPNYVVQPFDQDEWMKHEPQATGREVLNVFTAIAAMNRALYESLSAGERALPVTHPERGAISVDWIIHHSAGHLLHHVKQLEQTP